MEFSLGSTGGIRNGFGQACPRSRFLGCVMKRLGELFRDVSFQIVERWVSGEPMSDEGPGLFVRGKAAAWGQSIDNLGQRRVQP